MQYFTYIRAKSNKRLWKYHRIIRERMVSLNFEIRTVNIYHRVQRVQNKGICNFLIKPNLLNHHNIHTGRTWTLCNEYIYT